MFTALIDSRNLIQIDDDADVPANCRRVLRREPGGTRPWFDDDGNAYSESGWAGRSRFRRVLPDVPALQTIVADWRGFERMILDPIKASELQRVETCRAFFAGFQAALCNMERVGEDDVPEDLGVRYFETLRQEASLFAAMIGKGKK